MSGKGFDLTSLYKDVETKCHLEHVDSIAGLNSVESLTFLDEALLEQEHFGTKDSRPLILHLVKNFLQKERFVIQDYCKLFNDPVMGSVNVHPVAILMIDTPQFQRLRHISQLSTLSYVYPSGSHHRFEHSLGVYHLAGKLVNLLKEKQPELTITSIDAMCVQIMDSDGEELKESRELLKRIQRREIWKCVGQARVDSAEQVDVKGLQAELIKQTGKDNIRVELCRKNFGKKDKNPLDYTRFYAKSSPMLARNLTDEEKSIILPKQFQHQAVSVYCTSLHVTPDVYTAVEEAFKQRNLSMSSSHD